MTRAEEHGQRIIRIERPSRFADRAIVYQINLDDQRVCSIEDGGGLEISVAPGRHEIHLTADVLAKGWCRSPIIALDVPPPGDGDHATPITLRCTPAMASLWRQALTLLYATVLRGRYIRLERVASEGTVT